MVRGIIYDLGGVLITDGVIFSRKVFAHIGISQLEAKQVWGTYDKLFFTGEMNEIEWWRKFIERTESKVSPEEAVQIAQEYCLGYERNLELARRIKESGKYKTAIMTNNSQEWLDFQMERFKLEQCVDVIVSSHQIGVMKPDHRIYQHTLEQLQLSPQEAVFIDDNRKYIDVATELGITAILLTSPDQLYYELKKVGIKIP